MLKSMYTLTMVAKWCKRTNRELSPLFARYNPMRVTCVVKERDPE